MPEPRRDRCLSGLPAFPQAPAPIETAALARDGDDRPGIVDEARGLHRGAAERQRKVIDILRAQPGDHDPETEACCLERIVKHDPPIAGWSEGGAGRMLPRAPTSHRASQVVQLNLNVRARPSHLHQVSISSGGLSD